MKKILLAGLMSLLFVSNAFCATGWSKAKPAGTDNPSTIDTSVQENNTALDLMLSKYQEGCKITYDTAAQFTVGAGGVCVSNSSGATRLMLANTAATTVTWTNIDTGAEAASTTYYVYAIGSATTDTTFTVKTSLSSTAPTGVTYYKRLGSFYNDASSNITLITNDNNMSNTGKTYDSGWFQVAVSSNYAKTHSLGTTKVLLVLLGAASTDGSGDNYLMTPYYDIRPASDITALGVKITTTVATIYTGQIITAWGGSGIQIQSLKIVLLALDT